MVCIISVLEDREPAEIIRTYDRQSKEGNCTLLGVLSYEKQIDLKPKNAELINLRGGF